MHSSVFRVPNKDTRPSPGRSDRIAILGAGPAGLSAAHFLRKQGFFNVVVFEREHRVGGKCNTVDIGGRSYELGAAVISPLYSTVRALMRETGTPSSIVTSGFFVDPETGSRSYMIPSPASRRWLNLGSEGARYLARIVRDRELWTPGFAHLGPGLAVPFSEWAKREGYEEIAEIVKPWFTGFGYGYFEEIPAAYVLKYMTVCGVPLAELPDGGFQGLWQRVARGLDVRLGVTVQRIERSPTGVKLTTSAGPFEADWLVLACPFEGTLGFLDASAEERALFEPIRYIDYRVVAASAEGLGTRRFTFCPTHLASSQKGEPMFWYRRHKDADVYTFYSIGRPKPEPIGETVERVGAMVRALGGRLGKVHCTQMWRYFPHVEPQVMAGGYYARFDELQGRARTFYTGELLSFPTVENVATYSKDLVARFFASETRGDFARTAVLSQA